MRHILYSICLMLFIDGINNGLIFPMLPELFMNHNLGLKVDNRYFSRETFYSLSLALFPLSSIFGMPILGALSDRYEKTKVILCGLIGLIINSVLIMISILTHNLWLFLFTRLLGGFLSGTYAACNALISHISNNDLERINNLKLPTLASMSGFILGPGLLVFINQVKVNNPLITPFIIVCILGIFNLFLLWSNFRKTKIKNYIPKSTIDYSLKLILTSSMCILSNQYLKKLAFIYLLFTLGFGLFVESLSLHLAYNLNYTTSNIGIFFVIMLIIMAVSMYLLQKLIIKHINYRTQIKLSVLIVATLLIFGAILRETVFINNTYITWIITALFYAFIPFSSLGFINLFANSVSKEEQGKIIGSSGQISSIGFFIAGLLVGDMVTSYNSILLISGISLMLSYIMFKNLIK